MITGLENLTNTEIRTSILNLKKVMLEVINHPDPHTAGQKECSPAAMFSVHRIMLEAFEAEVFKRNMDPRHPAFGIDILTEIGEIDV